MVIIIYHLKLLKSTRNQLKNTIELMFCYKADSKHDFQESKNLTISEHVYSLLCVQNKKITKNYKFRNNSFHYDIMKSNITGCN